uniref:Uncharacterized protein n=2 Tax=Oryza sativa subsp. japonica TaxID=39947 RepID=Q2RA51_ORYSJ|nr:hypothetical protein LOC_Os11g06530 [Oryza sativa Japonica Group]ABA91685.1 hypothetical protein LOC_Os11g06530 [Oryza sativa Japonica Group]
MTEPITVTVARTDSETRTSPSSSQQSHSLAMMTGEGNKLVFLDSVPERPYDLDTLLRASVEVMLARVVDYEECGGGGGSSEVVVCSGGGERKWLSPYQFVY